MISPEAAPVRLRFGQEVVLECPPEWGGDHTLYVGFVERRDSMSINGALLSSGSAREYVLQDPLDASHADAAAVYGEDDPTVQHEPVVEGGY